jgi:hypothetical protein
MIFPFNLKYQTHISNSAIFENSDLAFVYLKNEFIHLKIIDFSVKKDEMSFKNTFFNGQKRGHPLTIIDSGTIKYNKKSNAFLFSFSTLLAFIISITMSLFMGFISENYVFGIFVFYMEEIPV